MHCSLQFFLQAQVLHVDQAPVPLFALVQNWFDGDLDQLLVTAQFDSRLKTQWLIRRVAKLKLMIKIGNAQMEGRLFQPLARKIRGL